VKFCAAKQRLRVQASIDRETQRQNLVTLQAENKKQEADTEAYAVTTKMEAFKTLPVENLKAMALANMQPDQLRWHLNLLRKTPVRSVS